jgi:beta-galactosidase
MAAALAAGMIIPTTVFAAGPVVKVGTDSSVQMSSDPEAVYVNNYTGTTRSENFNDNWKFYMGDAAGAESPAFNDSTWEQVNLPHDYSIEQEYTETGEAESGYLLGGTGWYRKNFTVDSSAAGKRIRIDFGGVYMNSTVWVNGNQVGTHPYGYTPFSFDITDYVNFGGDNVITVKVEHQTPSSRWYSGSGIYRSVDLTVTDPVHVDLYGTKIETPDLAENQTNVATNIKTTVVNDSAEAKSVTLTHTVFPKDGEPADSIGTMTTDAVEVAAGSSEDIDATVQVTNPTLWDTSDNPALYTVRTEVKVNDQVVDTYDTEYGFRYFKFDSNNGFYLNGERMKLQGVCMHHDQGSLGAEAWESAINRQVRIMKEMGCNSIRVTHNPASDELIEACNEQGILVIDEAFDGWAWPKNGNSYDYSRFFNEPIGDENQILGGAEDMTWAQFDLTAMIKRGQNAPSVIMWSLGNEVQEGAGNLDQHYANIQAKLITWAAEADDTRPVTRGCNVIKGQTSGIAADMMDSLSEAGGVAGFNYNSGDQYDTQHQANPKWFIYGAETASSINSRGVYDRLGNGEAQKPADQKLTSYDNSRVGWGALASSAWYEVIKRDFVAGEYVWTGFDYIGEPTPWNGTGSGAAGSTWPSPKNSYFGIVDTAGLPKDTYYFYQSQWNDEVNTLHILPAWNEDVVATNSDDKVPVVVYTDAAKVELFFTPAGSDTAQSLGEKKFETVTTGAEYTYQIYTGEGAYTGDNIHKNLYLTWDVPYEDGTITAKAWDANGEEIDLSQAEGRTSVTTTGDEAVLDASADRTEIAADGTQLSYITVNVEDADGNIVPDADDRVTFTVEGEGKLLAVDNGKQDDHQSYQDNNRQAFNGQLVAIVQSTKTAGDITVTASADGLESSSVEITTTPVENEGGETVLNYYRMSRNYYVKLGNMPQLPQTVKAAYSDGTEKGVAVKWDEVSEDQITQTGTFSVAGTTAEGDRISVTVNMIDEVAALLNYSTTVPVGQEPILPESRPAVLQNGEVISASFPVTWGEPEGSYEQAGPVMVKGTANVLGQEMTVTATVRVQEQQIEIGDNVAGQASELSQDIEEQYWSDTLSAINDGNTAMDANTSGDANTSAWSNWNSTNKNHDTDAEITFRYDTQQRIGQVIVYFAKDGSGLRYPDAETTEIYISETGEADSWTLVSAEETVAAEDISTNVRQYTYDFEPQTATYVKLYVKNPKPSDLENPSVAITEVVINEWEGSYTTNSTAALQSLTVNGLEATKTDLANGYFNTEAIVIDPNSLQYAGADNAAVTYIPPYENAAKLIIESEDHSNRTTFTIILGAEPSSGDAADASRDYDYTKTTATAGSVHPGSGYEGPASNAVDNNLETWWHTNWQTLPPTTDFWITLELEEKTVLDALRYYGRDGSENGRVNEYKVEVSTDNEHWTTVSTGTWENTAGWKLAVFDQPTAAKYVRLTGVKTYGDSGNNKFMSAAEIRLRKAPDKLDDISGATVEPITKEVSIVDADHPVTLTGEDIKVSLDGKELRYGIDYIITSYENNTAAETATAVLQGLGQYGYTGTKEIEFAIKLRDPVMTGIDVTTPCKLLYTEGDLFDPSALVLTAYYDNGTTQTISYADNSADITFTLEDGTPLTAETALTLDRDGALVTVTYGGWPDTFKITVEKASTPAPGPENPGTDPENPNPGTPGTGGSGNGGSGAGGSQTGNGGKAVQTGDTANYAVWGTAAILAGAAVITAAKKKKSEK